MTFLRPFDSCLTGEIQRLSRVYPQKDILCSLRKNRKWMEQLRRKKSENYFWIHTAVDRRIEMITSVFKYYNTPDPAKQLQLQCVMFARRRWCCQTSELDGVRLPFLPPRNKTSEPLPANMVHLKINCQKPLKFCSALGGERQSSAPSTN